MAIVQKPQSQGHDLETDRVEASPIFERPIKGDIDRALSTIMHESRHKLMEAQGRIITEAAARGMLQSTRVIVLAADAADKIHAEAMKEATLMLRDFVERMGLEPTAITGWARPHLENLNNSVLGVICPNGFPAEHQRIVAQYRAVFQQRIDGLLRDVEIGYVKGAGFSARATMSEEEWISAATALALLRMNYVDATRTICKRAHADLIKARAARVIRSGQPSDNVDVPSEFWWAEGERALTQNWETGDFETRLGELIQLQAFGVTFRRSDIEKMIPTLMTSAREAALERIDQRKRKMTATGKTVFIGHGREAIWRELKDFLQERLHLRVEEFDSVPVAGMTTASRLEEILNCAAFAFLIMTAEDEQPDGKLRARENVVHEAGLFQGAARL